VNDEAAKGFQYESPTQRDYSTKSWSKDEKDYAASISYLDDYVGKILDHLKSLEISQNTLVIFTSDNGPRIDTLRFNSSGPLRGFKRDLYEGGVRVPFIAWWPGVIADGGTSDHVSGFWDFLPTVCTLAGVKVPYTTDGHSFLPTLTGTGKQSQHEYIYFEFHEGDGSQAARKGKWKAVVKGIKTKAPSALELYDLENDPSEKTNLVEKFPEKAAEMKRIMETAHHPSPTFPFYSEMKTN
jgi:arylsulfatase A-like enzyme